MAHIGLLEDNIRIAKLCSTLLHYAGHEVTVYDHPQKCLQALLSNVSSWQATSLRPYPSLPVDMLILDLSLPDISGVDVLRSLQAHPHTRNLPLVLCTAANNAEVARALRVAPHAGIVEKPFKLQELISAISSALETVSQ